MYFADNPLNNQRSSALIIYFLGGRFMFGQVEWASKACISGSLHDCVSTLGCSFDHFGGHTIVRRFETPSAPFNTFVVHYKINQLEDLPDLKEYLVLGHR